jgi:hypothetical protein
LYLQAKIEIRVTTPFTETSLATMKQTTLLPLALATLFLSTGLVSARAGEIQQREQNQQGRIAEGIETGELTPAETARLEAREAELKKQIADDKAANGGKLTPAERKQINKELKHISHRIHHAKHNAKTTAPAATPAPAAK